MRRSWLGLRLAPLLLATLESCTTTARCRPGSALVTLSFDPGSALATSITLSISAGTGASKPFQISKAVGATSLSVEVDFATPYPAGQPFTVAVMAEDAAGTVVGQGNGSLPMLASGCSTLALGVTAASGVADLRGDDGMVSDFAMDLSNADDLSVSSIDMTKPEIDLATPDLTAPTIDMTTLDLASDMLGSGVQLVQAASSAAGTNTLMLTLSGIAKGDVLVATVVNDGSSVPGTPSGWQAGPSSGTIGGIATIFYSPNYQSTSVAVQLGASGATRMVGQLSEWSGASPTMPLPGLASVATAVNNASACGPGIPTDLPAGAATISLFGLVLPSPSPASFLAGAGWQSLGSDGADNVALHFVSDRAVPGQSGESEAETTPLTGNWACIIASIAP